MLLSPNSLFFQLIYYSYDYKRPILH